MKKSKEYSKKIQRLYRSLKRKGPKPEMVYYDDPVEALVWAIISEHITEKQTQEAQRRFAEYFLDLNDLRVSRPEEIMEMFGEDKVEGSIITGEVASNLKTVLHKIFEKYNMVSLLDLKTIGKRPAKETLEKIGVASKFAVDYCMLTAFGGHSIPLTPKMLEYLKSQELVHPEATEEEIEGFLTRQIPSKNGFEFYMLLRKESETDKKSPKKGQSRQKDDETAVGGQTKK